MGNATGIKAKLIIMNFLEFAVWGSYLVSMGIYLGSVGLGAKIFWFYTIQGIVSLFMPALVGIAADKWIPAQKMLAGCQGLAGFFMLLCGFYCMSTATPAFGVLFSLYTLSVAFYMPTIGLGNSVAFNALNKAGLDTVKHFPPIRVWGTVGFIFAELLVNFTNFQSSYMQFITSGFMSMILMCYAVTMPPCPVNRGKSTSLSQTLGLDAFKLFKSKTMAIFFVFSFLLGVCLQVTNSYGTLFINSFRGVAEFANDWAARNATALTAVSQASEALCILLIPVCLKRFGIKGVMLLAMFAWVLRFGFFGIGNTGSGVVFLVLSCIVYGVAFDFFNVAGGLFVDSQTDTSTRSSAQGLFMIMTNGLGASIGTWIAGTYVVNRFVDMSPTANAEANLLGWQISWFIFAAYALVISLLFIFAFRNPGGDVQKTVDVKEVEEIGGGDPEGMAGE
ncbi:MAG: MFS transporter [Muribaculaceae bacterium]|nr:MFS transporter [Muribaculaceae bacterium]